MPSCVHFNAFESASKIKFKIRINEFPGIHPIAKKTSWSDENWSPSNKMSNTGNNYSSDDLTVEKMLNKG